MSLWDCLILDLCRCDRSWGWLVMSNVLLRLVTVILRSIVLLVMVVIACLVCVRRIGRLVMRCLV